MRPPEATRITLISDTTFAPYSGMLPGLVAGHYQHRETHIDLRRLCSLRGVRFIEAAAVGVDLADRQVQLLNRPPVEYDVLSINVGAQPELDSVPGAREFAVPVKPVSGFYRRWQELELQLSRSSERGEAIVLVGGGAGSVELALAIRHRLGAGREIVLLCGDELLPGYNGAAQAIVRRQLQASGILLHEQSRVTAVSDGSVETSGRPAIGFTTLIWCTGVVPADWLRSSGLPCDERGFVLVDEYLRLEGSSNVFAAGDCAVQSAHPRPRAGVFAVRQAPSLTHNLRATIENLPLRSYRPQRRFLSLLSLGSTRAVADRGPLTASGNWVWRWKDRIDRRFMEQFTEKPPRMSASIGESLHMHCGGCGAKLPASSLDGVLGRLAEEFPDTVASTQLGEDAATIPWIGETALVQSVDGLRQLVDDPWQMGRIAALHALSDLYAMGATPHSAQVQIGVPYNGPDLQRRELYQLMAGIVQELGAAGARLMGGHSMEGPELTVGVTVNGLAAEKPLSTRGARPGDRLVLTKPLGVGVIFAGAMTGLAPGDAVAAAIGSMLRSNRDAAALAQQLEASACTDVTGFGLLGHLLEMLADAQVKACLHLDRLPELPGAAALSDMGVRSTLFPGNFASLPESLVPLAESRPLLCDPQTSGGLLIALPPGPAERLVNSLRSGGHDAVEIGEVVAADGGPAVSGG